MQADHHRHRLMQIVATPRRQSGANEAAEYGTNSAVTADGGEIGRAHCKRKPQVCPHTDMNPVLIKPSSDTGAQIVVHGKVRADMSARDYDQ